VQGRSLAYKYEHNRRIKGERREQTSEQKNTRGKKRNTGTRRRKGREKQGREKTSKHRENQRTNRGYREERKPEELTKKTQGRDTKK